MDTTLVESGEDYDLVPQAGTVDAAYSDLSALGPLPVTRPLNGTTTTNEGTLGTQTEISTPNNPSAPWESGESSKSMRSTMFRLFI